MSDALAAVWAFARVPSWECAPERPDDSVRLGAQHDREKTAHRDATSKPATALDTAAVTDLLGRLRTGDEQALGVLYDWLYEPLWRLSLILLHSAEAAEEIVHDVFLTLWEQRATLVIRGDIRTYLSAAVRNRARNVRKHERVVIAMERAVDAQTMDAPALARSIQQPDIVAESAEFYQAYIAMLSALTERDQVALRLRWEDDMTFEQIGTVLGISTVGARAVVLRAQEKVQRVLRDHRP